MNDFYDILQSALIQLVLFSSIPFIWWLCTARDKNFFTWLGFKKPTFTDSVWKIVLLIIGAAVLYILLIVAIMTFLMPDTANATNQFSGKGLAAIPSILVYALIQTSLSEEIFFRGFLCKRFTHQFGFRAGNLMQGLLFGLAHGIPFGLGSGNWLAGILMTILPTGFGYLQGWLNEKKAGGSILPSWALHGTMNLLSALAVI